MGAAAIVRIRVGWETILIGPRVGFVALIQHAALPGGHLASEYEVRRRLLVALYDPALLGALRRALDDWRGDGARTTKDGDRALIDRVALMTRNGTLIAYVAADPAMKFARVDSALEAAATQGRDAPAQGLSVANMSLTQRIWAMLLLVPNHLEGEAKEQFMALIAPEAIATTVAVLAVWAVSHFYGAGEVVDAALVVAGYFAAGPAIWDALKQLRTCLTLVYSATSQPELDQAADALAAVIAAVGIAVFVKMITHVAGRQAAKWGEKKPSVRTPVEEPPPPKERFVERPAPEEKAPPLARDQRALDDLARDPAHAGKIGPKSIQERSVGLDLEARGDVPGPIVRDPSGAAEFIDGAGQKWDVKGFNSNFPPKKGGFDLVRDADKLDASLAQGENVMLDTSQMSGQDIQALKAEGANRNWGDRVKWWP